MDKINLGELFIYEIPGSLSVDIGNQFQEAIYNQGWSSYRYVDLDNIRRNLSWHLEEQYNYHLDFFPEIRNDYK